MKSPSSYSRRWSNKEVEATVEARAALVVLHCSEFTDVAGRFRNGVVKTRRWINAE